MSDKGTGQVVAVSVAIVCILLALVGFVLGTLVLTTPDDQRIDHLGISSLAIFSSAILGLLAFLKANQVHKEITNGVLEATINKVLDERDRRNTGGN